ncbi:MAG: threonylcarbamoyl-AMP synthase [Oscillospiraceae bacterium]|nr:threonylcarbamoyl-AMP synthase [Oscillospiraceae bacterium]
MTNRVYPQTLRLGTGDLEAAAEILHGGGLVAVPTETVYGLACGGLDAEAAERIYTLKGRDRSKALSLLVSGAEALEALGRNVPDCAYRLAERFWPGPLTIVLEAKEKIPLIVRAGGGTVGLRCPDHPLTLRLLKICGIPLAAPSANPSGEPSPTTARQVLDYFDGRIEAVIDGGACSIGTESTVVSVAGGELKILRAGALSEAEIRKAAGET